MMLTKKSNPNYHAWLAISDKYEDEEIWRPIEGFEELYHVSNHGRVKSIKHGRFVYGSLDGSNYYQVCLQFKTRHRDMMHVLVAKAFLPIPGPEFTQVNHIDGCRTHNHVSNLEWCTPTYNAQHAVVSGFHKRISLETKSEMVRLWEEENLSFVTIANMFGTNKGTVSRIIRKAFGERHDGNTLDV